MGEVVEGGQAIKMNAMNFRKCGGFQNINNFFQPLNRVNKDI